MVTRAQVVELGGQIYARLVGLRQNPQPVIVLPGETSPLQKLEIAAAFNQVALMGCPER